MWLYFSAADKQDKLTVALERVQLQTEDATLFQRQTNEKILLIKVSRCLFVYMCAGCSERQNTSGTLFVCMSLIVTRNSGIRATIACIPSPYLSDRHDWWWHTKVVTQCCLDVMIVMKGQRFHLKWHRWLINTESRQLLFVFVTPTSFTARHTMLTCPNVCAECTKYTERDNSFQGLGWHTAVFT